MQLQKKNDNYFCILIWNILQEISPSQKKNQDGDNSIVPYYLSHMVSMNIYEIIINKVKKTDMGDRRYRVGGIRKEAGLY